MLRQKLTKSIWKLEFVELQRLLPIMETTYIYENVLRLRLPTAVAPLHSQPTEMVGTFHKWESFHERKSCLIRLTINTNFFYLQKSLFHSFL